ncbi:DnaK suppressor protein [Idiomarina sp. A28L]|uniref:TraR/DksA family transcriptional regulator n=1 Tax=Idiomarina sp. A28L TaxID=1036674 RepID=UPI0002138D1A|nr:TraR/DksA family transcriptional regulator [Idiomarina sp. A28L]EGN76061.1 DnaK suppressor protein [Idiomarina sp. A28L]
MAHDVDFYRNKLEQLRAEIIALNESSQDSEQPVELDQQSIGRLSRMDAMQGQQMAQANKRRREKILRAITAALVRIDNDDFGYCIECGDEINEKRLEIDPTTAMCIQCMQELEKHP